jgi:syntaxin-binding protein 5
MLGDLETSVNSLEQGSKSMLAQAKLLAVKQTAKSWMPKF